MLVPVSPVQDALPQPDKNTYQSSASPHLPKPTSQDQTSPVMMYNQGKGSVPQITASYLQSGSGATETRIGIQSGAAEERQAFPSAGATLSSESAVCRPPSGESDFQGDANDWPPPYQPSETDVSSVRSLSFPELPPPPLPEPDVELLPLVETALPPPPAQTPQERAHGDPSASPSSYRTQRQICKFPVNLYVPPSTSDRRPSNTSHYDNLSEEDDSVEKLLEIAATLPPSPETGREISSLPPLLEDGAAHLWPHPPSFFYIPDSAPPSLPQPCLPAMAPLPQELDYRGPDSWVTSDCIFPQPPPAFADTSSPASSPLPSLRSGQASRNQSDTYRNQLRPPKLPVKPAKIAQSPKLPPVRPEPGFNRMHVPNRQLPKPVTS